MKNVDKLHRLRSLHLFAGAGGGILADILLGHHPICAVEIDKYCQQVLSARQKDGSLPFFPIWDDVKTFDGHGWKGIADIICGGFPCQDISYAGKGAGIAGERSGLWKEFFRIIGEVRPRYAFIENSPALVRRGLDVVLSDLAAMGYDAEWGMLSAAAIGANHRRERIWILAVDGNANSNRESVIPIHDETSIMPCNAANTSSIHAQRQHNRQGKVEFGRSDWWQAEPAVRRVDDGVAYRMDRLKAIGNGQVPLCAATAWNLLMKRL